ncbi:hypothetical protein [Vitiosangium sp. GDMCC 1.1324]|uniref:hypothetical protein n=1 Tax=Vitiosangium sp. (strain GDMCC 1.1324) TaxID=2138576 RepID=UPI000D3896D3|nr:hypothetical protein [Vitiosangium sp. GDMCC 1.1324]PTL81818.1 hypothetical protein DAT35_23060 [Vitiosangium sp. GDMCC 1.1324]
MKTRASFRIGPFLLAGLLAACDSTPSLPQDHPSPEPFEPVQTKAQADVASAPGFADQTGGGIFATAAGEALRLRLDGTRAALENHPGNTVEPGPIHAVFRMGPGSALVEADNGLFMAQSGWLIAPSWREALGAGLKATAVTPDGAAWLGHDAGLYRLQDGAISALKADGKPLDGISALAAAPVENGAEGLWFLRQGKLWTAALTAPGNWQVRQAEAPLLENEQPVALVALGASEKGKAEAWVLTSARLLRRAADGWRQVSLAQKPTQVLAAGRFVWVRAGDKLLVYDADAETWGEASGVDTREFLFLAADESGCAWVQLGADTVALTRGKVPRVLGMLQGMQVVEDSLVVRARLMPGVAPLSVTFEVAGVEVPVRGPVYSLGGAEADGTPKPYSFVGLEPGPHTLSAVARYADGTEARRSVAFDYQPLSTVALGWDKDIRPIHESRCAKCHVSGPGRPLSSYELWKENVPLIVTAVREQRMPADGPLDPQLISLIQRWAATGANP